jgi:hypothetical protein
VNLLLGREDVASKESVSFLILTSVLHFCFILLNLFYLYPRAGEGTSMAGSDPMNL